jgi:fatty-acyl-CoA synthase
MNPHDRASAGTLVWDVWRRNAERAPAREAIVHVSLDQEPFRWRWGELMRAGTAAARWLSAQGVRRGEVCALILRHHPAFYPLYMGISCLGALPAVLAYPNARLHPDKFRQGLQGMASRSGLDYLVTERDLQDQVAPLVGQSGSTVKRVLLPLEDLGNLATATGHIDAHAPASPNEPCLLQHSSGTTGLQKAVTLSHRAVLEHVERYAESIALTGDDKVASWLPLYHDMGLIAAFYLPLVRAIPVVQLSPLEWVTSPVLLLQAIARERATVGWLPNFAYNFMADRVRDEDLDGVRLDSVRLLVNCSEPVRAESHARFARRLEPHGLRARTLSACYAMAETTFAVTQTPPGMPARTVTVDRAELARGQVVPVKDGAGRVCVSSGAPIAGCAVRIVDDARRDLPPGRVGEIAISSVSLFDGYRNYPEKTAEVLQDGWYHSGDYGFLHDGECYVIGRKKDIIIVAGNNVAPEDVEDVIGQVPGVAPGRVVAFGADDERVGTEMLCVVAETPLTDVAERHKLRTAIVQACMAIDVTISRVYLAEPRWLIKSSSGKLGRAANRDRAMAELAWR